MRFQVKIMCGTLYEVRFFMLLFNAAVWPKSKIAGNERQAAGERHLGRNSFRQAETAAHQHIDKPCCITNLLHFPT